MSVITNRPFAHFHLNRKRIKHTSHKVVKTTAAGRMKGSVSKVIVGMQDIYFELFYQIFCISQGALHGCEIEWALAENVSPFWITPIGHKAFDNLKVVV